MTDEEKNKEIEETPVEAEAEVPAEAQEAAQPPVRDSGPGEGASGEPGGSPADEEETEGHEEETPEEPEEEAAPEEPEAEPLEEEEAPAEPAAEPEAEAAPEEATPEEPEAEPSEEEGEPEPAAEAPSKKKAKPKRLPRSQRRQRPKVKRERPAQRKPIVRLPKPEHDRGRSQERRGVVVSSAMDKTIVVQVEMLKRHRRYKKVIRSANKFHVHDERNEAKVGDVVRIVETRPLSKTKNWRLAEIVEVAQ
jgi:small subunit ribosomal protein S17